jgi:Zn finger protein HypA/HybF involved in hydrogenase expression
MERAKMQKINSSTTFTCPRCKETFKFDHVGEYQLVPCPICGIEFITIRKGQELLLLEPFESNQKSPDIRNETARLVELELR